ncbi:MAG: hypothetical protein HY551_07100, partial [Elusimicrobia bacterium]|nr:hypothetical protein [Elusimicrobiota bacterium]
MKLSAKWILWYLAIGLYVMFFAGVFYYYQYKGIFDEQLKRGAIDMVRVYAPTLIKGLSRNQAAITLDEFDIVTRIAKDERVASLAYLNRFGEVRWFKDANKIGLSFDEFAKQFPPPTDAIELAYSSKNPRVRPVADQPLYEAAIPLAVRGDVVGIIDLQVSRIGAEGVIRQALQRYILVGSGVLLIMGITLYFFMFHSVLNPLLHLRDAIEAISFKSLELKFSPRKDEIGELAHMLQVFLQKVKAEMANTMLRERQ